jgi:HSP20 family protein
MANESWLPSLFGGSRNEVDPFRALRKEMDALLNDWAGGFRPLSLSGEARFSPSVDVSETDQEIRIVADLPGVSEKDVEVTLSGDMLTIKGERKSEKDEKKEEKGHTWHRVERSFGSFQRSMRMPAGIDPAKVAAEFKNGVLTVTLPKPAELQKQSKRIEIKSRS